MKVVILAGGFGSRLAEETSIKPKPMELCVFPAELQHYVTRNNNKKDRLSLAFNVKITPIYDKPY